MLQAYSRFVIWRQHDVIERLVEFYFNYKNSQYPILKSHGKICAKKVIKKIWFQTNERICRW